MSKGNLSSITSLEGSAWLCHTLENAQNPESKGMQLKDQWVQRAGSLNRKQNLSHEGLHFDNSGTKSFKERKLQPTLRQRQRASAIKEEGGGAN